MSITEITERYKNVLVLMWVLLATVVGLVIIRIILLEPNYEILYVSQDELIALEQARIKSEPLAEQQLFKGNIDMATKLALDLPQLYKTKHNKIIYSISTVTGEGVRSISEQVHAEIIRLLEWQ